MLDLGTGRIGNVSTTKALGTYGLVSGASKMLYDLTKNAANTITKPGVTYTAKAMNSANNPSIVLGSGSLGTSVSPGGLGSPGGSTSPGTSSNSPFQTNKVTGKVEFTDKNLQAAMEMINQQSRENNLWSAEQAQRQMDFQREMSDTAHQREVADLQAAGLNPVLSAGGSGAQVTSGAMGQTDDSNTRLIAELALGALDAVSSTAVGVAGATSKKNNGLLGNYFVKKFLNAAAGAAGYQVAHGLFKALF